MFREGVRPDCSCPEGISYLDVEAVVVAVVVSGVITCLCQLSAWLLEQLPGLTTGRLDNLSPICACVDILFHIYI